MSLATLVKRAADKSRFLTLDDYVDFAVRYAEFAADGIQARIVAQNEHAYCFLQYKRDGHYNITRPLNTRLLLGQEDVPVLAANFALTVRAARELRADDTSARLLIRRGIYTMQQSIGAALDALPSGQSNTARKVNGDLFERLIRIVLGEAGVSCESGVVQVPVHLGDEVPMHMSYQHDLIIRRHGAIKALGSVKTSSKDRIDKIFMDRLLYSRLTETALPHIAVFLNDVQRKKTAKQNRYSVNSTFLAGRYKVYTIRLGALDGTYYCDMRPNMETDPLLTQHIHPIDHLLCDDVWAFVRQEGEDDATVIKTE